MLEALASGPELAPTPRARLLTLSATLGQGAGDPESSRRDNELSMELFREVGDEDGLYVAMGTVGLIALGRGRPEEGLSLMESSAERRLELFGDKWASSAMFGFSATAALGLGQGTRARRLAERALSLAREVGPGSSSPGRSRRWRPRQGPTETSISRRGFSGKASCSPQRSGTGPTSPTTRRSWRRSPPKRGTPSGRPGCGAWLRWPSWKR